jgi:hypothetical protein
VRDVGFFLDEADGQLVIWGRTVGASRKFLKVQRNPWVAFVVDDIISTNPRRVRGIRDPRSRGRAERRRPANRREPGDHPHNAVPMDHLAQLA